MIPCTTDNYLQRVVPENIHIAPSHPRRAKEIPYEVGSKRGQFPGGVGGGFDAFFPGLRIRLVNYYKLTVAPLSMLSVISDGLFFVEG